MDLRSLVVAATAVALTGCARWASPPRFGSLKTELRPYHFAHNIELVQVRNGLKVALIRDLRTNLVTVDVRYKVGAAEDPPGRAGMAHLVEHLLFETRATAGGPTLGDELSELALAYNAWTRPDETHYTTTAPAASLDAILAVEARRMRTTCDQLDEATFARERDVVLAEETQRSSPLDATWTSVLQTVYGADHPYARRGRGEIAKATRAEVCAFIADHYTPDRAILVVTGPIDVNRTVATIGPAFGPIPRGTKGRAKLLAERLPREASEHTGPIDHPTVIVFFAQLPWGTDGRKVADLVDRQLEAAVAEAAEDAAWVRSTSVAVVGDYRAPLTAVFVELEHERFRDQAVDLVFDAAHALTTTPESPRLTAIRLGAAQVGVVAAWDRLGDRGAWIADYLQYTDHHWFMLHDMAELDRIPPGALRARAADLTRDRAHVALIRPTGAGDTRELSVPTLKSHDLQPWRTPVDPAEAHRPLAAKPSPLSDRVEAYDLPNGLHVVLAADPSSPIVDARVVFPGGSAHEPRDRPGLARAASFLLGHDYDGFYDPGDVARINWASQLGTQSSAWVDETATTFWTGGIATYADWHVWQLSWLLDKGVYDWDRIDAMRAAVKKLAVEDDDEEVDEDALRFRERLFGKRHPYATPPYALRSLLQIGKVDLERWRRDHYRAAGATLIISGGFDLDKMRTHVRELFGPWAGGAAAELPPVPQPSPPRGPSWLAIRDDDLTQARITIAFLSASNPVRDQAARRVLAGILEDRVRLVREGMGASYGVNVDYTIGAGGGALVIGGLVDPARAGDVLKRVIAELAAIRAGGDTFDADFVRARRRALARAQAYTGGARAMASVIEDLAANHLPVDHASDVARQIARLTPAAVAKIAAADLDEVHMVVQVAGKPAVVDAAFAAVGVTPE